LFFYIPTLTYPVIALCFYFCYPRVSNDEDERYFRQMTFQELTNHFVLLFKDVRVLLLFLVVFCSFVLNGFNNVALYLWLHYDFGFSVTGLGWATMATATGEILATFCNLVVSPLIPLETYAQYTYFCWFFTVLSGWIIALVTGTSFVSWELPVFYLIMHYAFNEIVVVVLASLSVKVCPSEELTRLNMNVTWSFMLIGRGVGTLFAAVVFDSYDVYGITTTWVIFTGVSLVAIVLMCRLPSGQLEGIKEYDVIAETLDDSEKEPLM